MIRKALKIATAGKHIEHRKMLQTAHDSHRAQSHNPHRAQAKAN